MLATNNRAIVGSEQDQGDRYHDDSQRKQDGFHYVDGRCAGVRVPLSRRNFVAHPNC